jgi:hypothetical protein
MKKLQYIVCAFVIAMSATWISCSNFDELNTDPTRMQESNPGVFLNPVLYEVGSYNWSRYNGFTFHLMQSVVTTNNTGGLGWYYITDAAGDGHWTVYYRWLNNLREMEKQAVLLDETNYQAIAKTLQSWMYAILVESFGDIPMSEASRGDEGLLTPKFDTQADVYKAILQELDSANILFNEAAGLRYNTEGEMLYNTDNALASGVSPGIVKWRKFANSLRVRTLLRVLTVPGLNAEAEIRKMVNDPSAYPLFVSNEDAAELFISGVFPAEPPMTRPQDFTSYKVLSQFFIDNLKLWNDPRLPIFATQATNNNVKEYIGWPSGYNIAPSFNGSLPNQGIVKPPLDITFMSYAELEFIKAELALKHIITSNAEEHYKKGVKATIERWGAVMPANYFDNPETAFDGTLERIMIQKFYALFFTDYQQWFEYNRTGLPEMPVGDGVPAGNVMPHRFKYPSILQRNNMANYKEARDNMGGDDFFIKLIWQK